MNRTYVSSNGVISSPQGLHQLHVEKLQGHDEHPNNEHSTAEYSMH